MKFAFAFLLLSFAVLADEAPPASFPWQEDMAYMGWESLFPQIREESYSDASPFAVRKRYDYQLLIVN